MDLSLSLGQPIAILIQSMSEKEFRRWQNYASKRLLPWQRMEWYLAQICQLIAVTMGGNKNARIADFLCRPPEALEEEIDPEELLEMAIQEFDVKPRKRRK